LSRFMKDKTFSDYVDRFPIINEKSNTIIVNDIKEYTDVISNIYSFRGVDLSTVIKDFDVARLPVKGINFKDPYFKNSQFLWMQPIEMQVVSLPSVAIKQSRPIVEQTSVKGNDASEPYSSHRSDWQYAEAPNYREPILVAPSKENNAKILKAIEEFENIPDVLKECNIEAQKEYYTSLEKVSQKENKRLKSDQQKVFTRRVRGGRRGR